ncbi:MAG: YbaB/EbfC family nucleoid-associated protein [Termitinemataceae bacterium]
MDFNPFDLLKNAQKIQEQMTLMQQRLATIRVTGSAGAGMVEIDMNGKMEVLAVRIARDVVDPQDIPMLQDLIKAAYSNAMDRVREAIQSEVAGLTGGMGLPPGIPGMMGL